MRGDLAYRLLLNYSILESYRYRADFIAKLEMALKEANETGKWLEMLLKSDYISDEKYNELNKTCSTIRILLITSIKTVKENAT